MEKFDGLTLTTKQIDRINTIASDPEVIKARKKITLYKKSDGGLALFRAQATNRIAEITVRAAINRPLKTSQAQFVNNHICEPPGGIGELFCDFFRSLNTAVGFEYIQGVRK